MVLHLRVCVEVCATVHNLYMLEARSEQTGAVVFDSDSASDTANIRGHAAGNRFRQFSLESDIADGETTAGLENSGNFTKHGRLVRCKIQNAVGDHAID